MHAQSLSCVRLFATLWTVAHQAPLLIGFPRQEYWSELPLPTPGDLSDPESESEFPDWQADSLPLSHQGSPHEWVSVQFSSVQSLSCVRLFATP